MRVVAINEAEAILEPFWDGSSSEHPKDKTSLIEHYDVDRTAPEISVLEQQWHAAVVRFEGKKHKTDTLTMTRECSVDISEYNIFRVFGAVSASITLSIHAEIDGTCVDLCQGLRGSDDTHEIDLPLRGNRLQRISLEFTLDKDISCQAVLYWLGLSNNVAQRKMEAKISPYTPDWPDMLKEDCDYEPQIGILFGKEELPAIRRRLHNGRLAGQYRRLLSQAQADMALEPEKEVGYLIPKPDRRWVRDRDMHKTDTSAVMERLAFVGLIEQDKDMLRMSARMALSAAHCTHWCESIMGVFPGASWHHRSFTEEVYCRGCAMVLDWAGTVLTDYGKQAIRDAIIMKGLPRIESDFKRMEYIRSMNQGIVFSSGRIFGMLSLLNEFPRYRSLIEEAEKDLHEMIANYVMPDGSTSEGPGYWGYTFSNVMPLVYALSRFHGQAFSEYCLPSLQKTGEFALDMLSLPDDGIKTIPFNDAHTRIYPAGLMAAYYRLTGNRSFLRVLNAATDSFGTLPDIFTMIICPEESLASDGLLTERNSYYENGGLVKVRRIGQKCISEFMLFSGIAGSGHNHQDKGSFILNTDREYFCIDRGVTVYSHPMEHQIQQADMHNLLYPADAVSGIASQVANNGAKITGFQSAGKEFSVFADVKDAWQEGIFIENRRNVYSSDAETFKIEDNVICCKDTTMAFLLHTRLPVISENGNPVIKGKFHDLHIKALNWKPVRIEIEEYGIDEHLKPVTRIAMYSEKKKEHKLVTELVLLPNRSKEP